MLPEFYGTLKSFKRFKLLASLNYTLRTPSQFEFRMQKYAVRL